LPRISSGSPCELPVENDGLARLPAIQRGDDLVERARDEDELPLAPGERRRIGRLGGCDRRAGVTAGLPGLQAADLPRCRDIDGMFGDGDTATAIRARDREGGAERRRRAAGGLDGEGAASLIARDLEPGLAVEEPDMPSPFVEIDRECRPGRHLDPRAVAERHGAAFARAGGIVGQRVRTQQDPARCEQNRAGDGRSGCRADQRPAADGLPACLQARKMAGRTPEALKADIGGGMRRLGVPPALEFGEPPRVAGFLVQRDEPSGRGSGDGIELVERIHGGLRDHVRSRPCPALVARLIA